MPARKESVIDEEIFLDPERRIRAVEVARPVIGDAVTQREILRARRCTNRVGLHEAEAADRLVQAGRRKEASCDGVAAKLGELDGEDALP